MWAFALNAIAGKAAGSNSTVRLVRGFVGLSHLGTWRGFDRRVANSDREPRERLQFVGMETLAETSSELVKLTVS